MQWAKRAAARQREADGRGAGNGAADGAAGSSGGKRRQSGINIFAVTQLQKWQRGARNTVLREHGIPLREGLQILYKVHRDKFMFEACVFLTFFMVFAGITYEAYNVHTAWEQNHAVIDLFLDEEFEGSTYKKNFFEIQTDTEYYQWLKGPVVQGMFPDTWYNGDNYTEKERGYVLHYLRRVGGVQVRQLRVRNDSCFERRFVDESLNGVSRFDSKDGTCYSEFRLDSIISGSSEETTPYGPGGIYHWSDGHVRLWGLYGFGPSNYGTGGYVVTLPNNVEQSGNVVDQLERNRFVDRGTRAMVVEFTLYNTNTRLATTGRFVVEWFASGAVQPSFELFSYRLLMYSSRSDTVRAMLEVVYVVLFFYQVQKEARRFYWTHPRIRYFGRPKNMFECAYLLSHLVMVVWWLTFLLDGRRDTFTVNAPGYVNYFDLAYNYLLTFTVAGWNCLMSCFKLFKYLSINRRMNILWVTLLAASLDLAMFSLGLVIIVLGFAMMGNLVFGHILRDFHNLAASVSTLTRFTLGDFDYDELSMARPRLAAPYFWLYTAVVFVVVMNMFIAIITRYFDQVHSEAQTAERWKEGMPDLTWDIAKACRRFCRSRVKPKCGLLYDLFMLKPCRKRSGDDDVVDDNPLSGAGTPGAGGYNPTSHKEALTVQLTVWEREQELVDIMRKCAHAAKIHKYRSLDLYHYFYDAYSSAASASTTYVSLDELCQLTRDTPSCEHADCVAKLLVLAYTNLKQVVLIGGSERRSGSANLARRARYQYKYTVTKVNKWGRRNRRIVAVDSTSKELHSFDLKMNLRQALPLRKLVQVDVSNVDSRRLKLTFDEGTAAGGGGSQYNVVFQDDNDRNEFKELILKVANAVQDATEAKDEELAAGGGASDKISSMGAKLAQILAVNGETRHEIRMLSQKVQQMSNQIEGGGGRGGAATAGPSPTRASVPAGAMLAAARASSAADGGGGAAHGAS